MMADITVKCPVDLGVGIGSPGHLHVYAIGAGGPAKADEELEEFGP